MYSIDFAVPKMSSENLIDLCSDNEMGDSGGKAGEKRPHYALGTLELEGNNYNEIKKLRGNSSSSNVVGISQSGSSVLEQGCCVDDESSPSFLPSLCPPPVCRQFWKAGNYEMEHSAKAPIQSIAIKYALPPPLSIFLSLNDRLFDIHVLCYRSNCV